MTTWINHMMIADNLSNRGLDLDKNGFGVGNIAPDCNVENEDWTAFTIVTEIKKIFADDSSGHDHWHTLRVYNNAMNIAEIENCDKDIVALGALLHDVDDIKLFSTVDYDNARTIMKKIKIDEDIAERVIEVISTVSFSGKESVEPKSIEGKIVQDADRLDAIGAIGIARAFAYGGNKGRCMYNSNIEPFVDMDQEAYRNHKGTTVNHFYEKLFLLKDMMNTDTAKKIAEHRHIVMEKYIDEFLMEWRKVTC